VKGTTNRLDRRNLLKGEAEDLLVWLEVRRRPARFLVTEAGRFAVEEAAPLE
jgi:hypothetical protein